MILEKEDDWLLEYRKGNNDVIGMLSAKYRINLILVANKYVRDFDKAQDIVQDAIIMLLKRPVPERKNKPPSNVNLKNHIFKIVQSKSIDYFRRENKRKEIHTFWSEIHYSTESNANDFDSQNEKSKLPLHVLGDSDAKFCELLLGDYSVNEVCKSLNLTKENYRVIRQRVIRKLKREMQHTKRNRSKFDNSDRQ